MSRYRSQNYLASQPNIYKRLSPNPATVYSYGSLGMGMFREMTDEVIPGFVKRKLDGEIFFSPMSSTLYTASVHTLSGVLEFKCTAMNPTCIGAQHPSYGLSRTAVDEYYRNSRAVPTPSIGARAAKELTISSEVRDALITEASTRVLAERGLSNNNLWESLAEMDKSFKMLPGALLEARNVIIGARRSKMGREIKSLYLNTTTASRLKKLNPVKGMLMKRVSAAANLYLLYRYGLAPLLKDIAGIMEGSRKLAGKMRSSSRAKVSHQVASTVNFSGPSQMTGVTQYGGTISYQNEITVRAMSLDEFDASVYFHQGFSAKGLLGVPWELTPYSFVVDWVANVGDLMYALIPSPGLRQLGQCVSVVENYLMEVTLTTESPWGGQSNWSVINQGPGSFSVNQVDKTRTVGQLVPGLVLKSDFKFDHLTRSMDAAALLLQTMKFPYR